MNELEDLDQIISNILSPDPEARLQTQNRLQNLMEQDFNHYILTFLNLLAPKHHSNLKIYCLEHLQGLFSAFQGPTGTPQWENLHTGTQRSVKQALIDLLKDPQEQSVTNVLCRLIGELAATISHLEKNKRNKLIKGKGGWPNLMKTVWTLLRSKKHESIDSGLRVLRVLYHHSADIDPSPKEEIMSTVNELLGSENVAIRLAAMIAFSNYLKIKEFKERETFTKLVPDMLSLAMQVINEDPDLVRDALETFTRIFKLEYKIFKEHYPKLIDILKQVIKTDAPEEIKRTALEAFTVCLEQFPEKFKADKDSVNEILELLFEIMLASNRRLDTDFSSPSYYSPSNSQLGENFDPDELLDPCTKYIMGLVPRIITFLNKKSACLLILQSLQQIAGMEDWRQRYFGLTCLSQIGDILLQDIHQFEITLSIIIDSVSNESLKVRFLALYCLRYMIKSLKQQSKYMGTIIPVMINALKDQAPHIIYYALDIMGILLETCPQGSASKYEEEIVKCLDSIRYKNKDNEKIFEGVLSLSNILGIPCQIVGSPRKKKAVEVPQITLKASNSDPDKENKAAKSTDTMDEVSTFDGKTSDAPTTEQSLFSMQSDIVPIAKARKRRVLAKRVDYYQKSIEEEKERYKKRQEDKSRDSKDTKDTKDTAMEIETVETEESSQYEGEELNNKPKVEVGYEWTNWELEFNNTLGTLTEEEVIAFVKIVLEDKPQCVSFENGYLELKMSAAKVLPPLSKDPDTKINQMMIQTKTFLEFIGYIEKIKAARPATQKPKTKKASKKKNNY